MKSVLISIHPRWCELITSGKKTVEVRKTKPKLDTPFKVYIYCTKDNTFAEKTLRGFDDSGKAIYYKANKGKVIGEFVCDRIVRFENDWGDMAFFETVDRSYLSSDELAIYLGAKEYGYGWHISDLVIYDKPRELSEFYAEGDCDCSNCTNCRWFSLTQSGEADCDLGVNFKPITRPPQSWCYVESEDAE